MNKQMKKVIFYFLISATLFGCAGSSSEVEVKDSTLVDSVLIDTANMIKGGGDIQGAGELEKTVEKPEVKGVEEAK